MVGSDDLTYNIDTLKIRNLGVQWLPYLAYGVVDVAGREPYLPENQQDQEDLGLCVISSPIYVFIPWDKKEAVVHGLRVSIGDRFLPISPERNRLLNCGPRKRHIEHVLAALVRALVPTVNVYSYGTKSLAAYFLFLDDINREDAVELDVGCYLRPNAGSITLVKPRAGAQFQEGSFGKFPMLASVQRTNIGATFGSFRWAAFGEADGVVWKVKIYSGLVHCLKSFGRETNFGTLPKTGKMFHTRISQGREFLIGWGKIKIGGIMLKN